MAEPDFESLLIEATDFFSSLRAAQVKMPERSIQRNETGRLAHAVDCWCRLVEDNVEDWHNIAPASGTVETETLG